MKVQLLMGMVLLLMTEVVIAQSSDTTLLNYQGNQFYYIQNPQHSKVLIFLHGGVNNHIFKNSRQTAELTYLLEENENYVSTALNNGFDVLLPIANERFNWLNNYEYCFEVISFFLDSIQKHQYRTISGFSDGGTGSYKIFYSHLAVFDALVVFNAYPQHKNFNQTVAYETVKDKKVIFFSTFNDKIIPYEFLLTEYCKQKGTNPNTYFFVEKGRHSFHTYDHEAMEACFDILTSRVSNQKTEAIHALIVNDQIVDFYPFRKRIYKKFAYGEEYYKLNIKQARKYNK